MISRRRRRRHPFLYTNSLYHITYTHLHVMMHHKVIEKSMY